MRSNNDGCPLHSLWNVVVIMIIYTYFGKLKEWFLCFLSEMDMISFNHTVMLQQEIELVSYLWCSRDYKQKKENTFPVWSTLIIPAWRTVKELKECGGRAGESWKTSVLARDAKFSMLMSLRCAFLCICHFSIPKCGHTQRGARENLSQEDAFVLQLSVVRMHMCYKKFCCSKKCVTVSLGHHWRCFALFWLQMVCILFLHKVFEFFDALSPSPTISFWILIIMLLYYLQNGIILGWVFSEDSIDIDPF